MSSNRPRTNRVAIYRADLLPASETFIRDQARALPGWEPVLLGRREVPGGLQTPGVPRAVVPETRSRLESALRFWLSLPDPRVVERLKALDVDLVHAHFGVDATDIWPSVRAAGLPMAVTLHGYDINIDRAWWEAGHGGRRRRVYPRRLIAMLRDPAVRCIAVSRAVQRRAIEYGIPAEKVALAYIGVDTQRFSPGGLPLDQRRKRILFVGRMVEKKAPLLMVRAFAQVREQVPDAELVMIGDGPLLPAARELAAGLHVPVSFRGACSSEEVLAQLHESRVFCLPSVTAPSGDAEGLPISILEAQACGVPVVTSARGAVGEAIDHGENGLCVGEHELRELAGALEVLLLDDALLLRLAKAARARATALFSHPVTASMTVAEYDRALGPQRSFHAQAA